MRKRSNVQLVTNALVDRILFGGQACDRNKQDHYIATVSYLVVAAQTTNERDQGTGRIGRSSGSG